MDEKRTRSRTAHPHHTETTILSRIVDAMLAVQAELQEATVEQWSYTLVDSCRRQKQWLDELHLAASSTC
jgi:hypothetical protein